MDIFRTALLYCHLLACCAAVGLILQSDLRLLARLLQQPAEVLLQRQEMHELCTMVTGALLVLWLTGGGLIWLDAMHYGWTVFGNPKLQAKLIVVLLLTINGCVLHRLVLPAWAQADCLLRLPWPQYFLAIYTGAMSAVSWLYAAFLGAAHALSWKSTLGQLLGLYPVLISLAIIVLLRLLRRRPPEIAAASAASRSHRPPLRS